MDSRSIKENIQKVKNCFHRKLRVLVRKISTELGIFAISVR